MVNLEKERREDTNYERLMNALRSLRENWKILKTLLGRDFKTGNLHIYDLAIVDYALMY